ncbi:MAG: hypothetical protein CMO06_15995 [Thalassospira sp.]|nr:hypothetical protein [Thalassospira sp.]MAZ33922.1 hypothetical protein [Thalassospira sp.]MAZ34641.1 hypothetical protein [Thalassospira sp.]
MSVNWKFGSMLMEHVNGTLLRLSVLLRLRLVAVVVNLSPPLFPQLRLLWLLNGSLCSVTVVNVGCSVLKLSFGKRILVCVVVANARFGTTVLSTSSRYKISKGNLSSLMLA